MGMFNDAFGDKSESKTKAWGPARGYIEDQLGVTAGLKVPEYYKGNLTAPYSQGMAQGLDDMYNWNQTGQQYVDTLARGGQMGIDAMGQGLAYNQQLQQQGPNQFQYDQGTFDQTMANLMPALQGTYNDATRDIGRNLNENLLPGINLGASMGGNAFGSRPQNQSAIAIRGAEDRASDIGSQLYQNAVNQGQQGAMTGGTLNMQSNDQLQRALMNSYQNYGQMGGNMINQAGNMGMANLQPAFSAGQWQTGYDQGGIDREVKRDMFNQMSPWQYEQQRNQMFMAPGTAYGTNTTAGQPGYGNVAMDAYAMFG